MYHKHDTILKEFGCLLKNGKRVEKKKSLIAYRGIKFTLEWYENEAGKRSALDYFMALSIERKLKFTRLIISMGDIGYIRNEEKFRHEGNKIYVFKPQPDRFFCFFFTGSKIIITNAYEKKSDKMPVREYEKAIKAQEDYIKREKAKKYYEEID